MEKYVLPTGGYAWYAILNPNVGKDVMSYITILCYTTITYLHMITIRRLSMIADEILFDTFIFLYEIMMIFKVEVWKSNNQKTRFQVFFLLQNLQEQQPKDVFFIFIIYWSYIFALDPAFIGH